MRNASPSIIPQLFFFCAAINFFINFQTLFVQDGLTPGDAGGNLYAVEAVTRGEIPYKDFWWNYGFLPFYYNALFFKLFGSHIQSLILARLILKAIFSGVFFLAAARIMPLASSVLAAIAFGVFMPEFKHNFSHYAGICMETGILWAVLSYYKTAKDKYIFWGWLFVLLLGFIKINFGVLLLLGTWISFILCGLVEHKKSFSRTLVFSALSFFAIILIWALTYYFFIKDLSFHQINQCFPLAKGYNYFNTWSLSRGIIFLFKTTLQNIQYNHSFDILLAGLTFIASFRLIIHMIVRRSCTITTGRNCFFISGILLILIICAYHEFIVTAGLDYQLYWAKPFTVMLIAYLISEACVISGSLIQIIVSVVICVLIGIQAYQHWKFLEQFKNKAHFFGFKHMNIYVTESPKDIKSMLATAHYIDKNIPPNSLFYTFPHDALYYYLTDHRMPTWLFSFYRIIHVTPEQEMDLIKNLEQRKVEYIVQGSVCYAGYAWWGKFGVDYGLLFDKYIKKYFQETARFGSWSKDSETTYMGGAGTRIFKKKTSQSMNIATVKDLE